MNTATMPPIGDTAGSCRRHGRTRPPEQRFDAAAAGYERHARVQHAVADHLLACIARQALPPTPRILEIGCGTGILTRKLAACFTHADWTITDLAPAMLEQARQALRLGGKARFHIMNGEHPEPPAADRQFDLICSSMALQWFDNPAQGMARLADLLAPGGCLAVAVPIRGTWTEWRAAHRSLGLPSATILFPSAARLRPPGDAFQADIHQHRYIDECGSALGFLRHLRGIGASAPRPGSRPLSVPQLRQVCAAFERSGARCSYRIAFSLWRRRGTSPLTTRNPADAGKA